MNKSDHICEDTINYLVTHLQNKKDFSSFSIEERRKYQNRISKQIDLFYKNNELDKRNKLVHLNEHMVRNLPFEFEVDELVLVKGKRTIKANIISMNPIDRQVFVKPIDNLCKESFYCPECWIIPIREKKEEEQMKLF